MVGTRSRQRKYSAVEHNSTRPTTTKLGSKKNIPTGDGISTQVVSAANPEILEPITLQPGPSSDIMLTAQSKRISAGPAQSLPHRSRSTTRLGENAELAGDWSTDSETPEREIDSHEAEAEQMVTDTAVSPKESLITASIQGTPISDTSAILDPHTVLKLSREGVSGRKGGQKLAPPSKDKQSVYMSSHKRFGSEDLPPQPEDLSLATEIVAAVDHVEVSDSQSGDDDDAPEEIVTNVAARKAKASAAKTAQSLKEQKDADRAKRRRRDLDLKAQAQTSKKRKIVPDTRNLLQDNTTSAETDPAKASSVHMDDLPDDLPAEILALEFDSSAEISNARLTQIKRPNKRKRLDQDVKPAKDIRVGSTTVRVLSTTNSNLPPPTRHRASNAKETWLRDRINESKTRMTAYKVKGAGARSFVRQTAR